jgi:hypothetical protein
MLFASQLPNTLARTQKHGSPQKAQKGNELTGSHEVKKPRKDDEHAFFPFMVSFFLGFLL